MIVNGGLGPTVDDLSQEVAAEAAGVPLALRPEWLENIQATSTAGATARCRRTTASRPCCRKARKLIDNPVGTACGFALDIGGARFFFTPGVPSELDVMTEDQLIPRLRAMSGIEAVMHLKRFHSFGIGESRADHLLAGIEAMDGEGRVKLGFQSHYPQLETKLAVAAPTREAAEALLEPIEEEVRRRLGHFIVAEDDGTLEGAVLERLRALGGTLSTVETGSQGGLAARLAAAVKRAAFSCARPPAMTWRPSRGRWACRTMPRRWSSPRAFAGPTGRRTALPQRSIREPAGCMLRSPGRRAAWSAARC